MILYVNSRNEIIDVNSTDDTSLTPLEVNDTDNPFNGWSVAKICCYKVAVKDGHVTMMTPYVDSRLISHIDQLGKQTEALTPYKASQTAYIDDTEVIFDNVPSGNVSVYMTDTDGQNAPYTSERINGNIKVSFEKRTSLATVTISIL